VLVIEYKVAEIFDNLKEYAESLLREAEKEDQDYDDVQLKIQLIKGKLQDLKKLYPNGNYSKTYQHLWFAEHHPRYLKDNTKDILNYDLPKLQSEYTAYLKSNPHLDSMLRKECESLLIQGEFDSAIRKAFIVLKERAVKLYKIDRNIDGDVLANFLFAADSGVIKIDPDKDKRIAFRNFVSSLFGYYRNLYAHNLRQDSEAAAEVVFSSINYILKVMEEHAKREDLQKEEA
jgi:hypothetical protein